MNDVQRQRVRDALKHVQFVHENLDEVWEKENDVFEALGPGPQEAPNGRAMQRAMDELEAAIALLDEAEKKLAALAPE